LPELKQREKLTKDSFRITLKDLPICNEAFVEFNEDLAKALLDELKLMIEEYHFKLPVYNRQ